MKKNHMLLLLFSGGLALSQGATGQAYSIHSLTIGVNPVFKITDAEVDQIIDGMNQMIRSKVYDWDIKCDAVQFVRAGPVLQDNRLLLDGDFEKLAANLAAVTPKANVMMVADIDCDGIAAAGCGPIGSEPMIVAVQTRTNPNLPDFSAELWLHERGHNVGLPHSAEFPSDDTDDPLKGLRVMFWQLGLGHVGKIQDECDHFEGAQLASISHSSIGPNLSAPKVHALAIASDQSGSLPASAADTQDSALKKAAAESGMTENAFKIVAFPWVEAIPVAKVKQLAPADVDSIRHLLKGSPNSYWPQAISALSLIGNEHDVDLVQHALHLNMPAVSADAQLSEKEIDQMRTLLKIKLSAPKALGIFANRTQSTDAVKSLQEIANVENASHIIGSQAAPALSKAALTGLSISNTPAAKNYLEEVFSNAVVSHQQEGHVVPANLKTAPLTSSEINKFKANASDVNKETIEVFLQKGARSDPLN